MRVTATPGECAAALCGYTASAKCSVGLFRKLIVDAEAARGAGRQDRLRRADAALNKVRLYLRLCREWNWLNPGQYQHAAQMIAEIGRLLGGWIKSAGM